MTLSIWAEPATKDAKCLRQIICSLGKKYNSPAFNPHITLYGGVQSVSDAKSAISNFAGAKKFTASATDLGSSDDLWKTVFINVEKSQKLKQVYGAIRKAVPQSPKYEFDPHISLIYKKMDNSERQAIIDGLKIKKKFTFDKITVIVSSKNVEKWKVIDRIILK